MSTPTTPRQMRLRKLREVCPQGAVGDPQASVDVALRLTHKGNEAWHMTDFSMTYLTSPVTFTDKLGRTSRRISPLGRLLRRVEVSDSGCWEWQGHRHDGYGRINIGGEITTTHRITYMALVGPVPAGLELDHLCRNRACCNPRHLEPVTRRTNSLRGVSPCAVNAVKTHCPRQHPYTPENTWTSAKGGRWCKTCNREKQRARNARLRESA